LAVAVGPAFVAAAFRVFCVPTGCVGKAGAVESAFASAAQTLPCPEAYVAARRVCVLFVLRFPLWETVGPASSPHNYSLATVSHRASVIMEPERAARLTEVVEAP